MKVKTLKSFRDRENALKLRKVGEQFEVTKTRGKKLTGLGLVEVMAVQDEKKG